MSRITQKELARLEELIGLEESMYHKFRHYADQADESHITRLCHQLADRSREHLTALSGLLDANHTGVH